MKKHIAFAAAVVFFTGLFAGFAHAAPGRPGPGRSHRHHKNLIEGVVIGADALILGTAIVTIGGPRIKNGVMLINIQGRAR